MSAIDGKLNGPSHVRRNQYFALYGQQDQYPSYSVYDKDESTTAFHTVRLFGQGNPICISACLPNYWSRTGFAY